MSTSFGFLEIMWVFVLHRFRRLWIRNCGNGTLTGRRRSRMRTTTTTTSGCCFMVKLTVVVCCASVKETSDGSVLITSRFAVHQRHHPQRLRWASRLHWRDVWSRDLLCRELFKEQSVRLRHRRWYRMSHAQRQILLPLPQVTSS